MGIRLTSRVTKPDRGVACLCAVVVASVLLGSCTAGQPPPPSGTPHESSTGSSTVPSATPAIPEPTNFSHGPADRSALGDDQVSVTTLVKHLQIPWGITFLPDGGALVTERHSLRILKVGPGWAANGELTVTPLATLREAESNNEGGLLGIAASPNFAKDQTVFVYYTTKVDNRIARLHIGAAPQPIVTGIPHAGVHNGGRLAFGPDGFLYATTGDASRQEYAQHISDLGGKILRMTTDGKPAPGNPFPGSLVWSYGHRNPEGMAWDGTGHMYAVEIGDSLWDELNVIAPGKNYGWPKVEGIGGKPGYVDPAVEWRPEVGVSAGIAIQGGTAVVTCLRGQRIYLVRLSDPAAGGSNERRVAGGEAAKPNVEWRPGAGVVGRPIEALTGVYGRLRTAIAAPDGSVWLSTSNYDGRNPGGPGLDDDQILRLTLHPAASPGGR